MNKTCITLVLLLFPLLLSAANDKEYLWPRGKMPDAQSQQIAATREEARAKGFRADKHRLPYLEWFDAPAKDKRVGACSAMSAPILRTANHSSTLMRPSAS